MTPHPLSPPAPPEPTVHDTGQPYPTPANPRTLSPQLAALEAIAHAREAALFTRSAVEKLLAIADAAETSPEFRPVVFGPPAAAVAGAPVSAVDRSPWEARSIGVLNPTPLTVFFGVGGTTASIVGHSPSVPPFGLLILPVHDYDVELAVDSAALGANNTATVFLMRYQSVQAPYLAKGA